MTTDIIILMLFLHLEVLAGSALITWNIFDSQKNTLTLIKPHKQVTGDSRNSCFPLCTDMMLHLNTFRDTFSHFFTTCFWLYVSQLLYCRVRLSVYWIKSKHVVPETSENIALTQKLNIFTLFCY